jgi:hypothetical protein
LPPGADVITSARTDPANQMGTRTGARGQARGG